MYPDSSQKTRLYSTALFNKYYQWTEKLTQPEPLSRA